MLKRISIYAFSFIQLTACSNQEIISQQDSSRKNKRVESSFNQEEPIVKKVAMVNFEFNSSKVHTHEMANIEQTLSTLNNMEGDAKILIKGHTDILGSNEYNYKLGLERAKEVKKMLVDKGISSKDVYIMSFGENKPLIDARDWDERYVNRRATTEVIVDSNSLKSVSMN